jgi:hypothetical protein
MAVHAETVELEARVDLSLWVRRGETGGVVDGVRTVLGDVDGVADLDVVEVTDVRPMANELRLGATVDLVVQVDRTFESRRAAARDLLADGFGVTDVGTVALDGDQ